MSTGGPYFSSYISGAINSGVPNTDYVKSYYFSLMANPKSPILT